MKTIIVGAGISGLATARALLERKPDLELLVLEATNHVGGKVWSDETQEGFLCESGVNAFLDSKPKTLALVNNLGLSPMTSYDASRHRFVFSDGRLRLLPESPPAFLRSNLLSVSGRLRVIFETLIPRGKQVDESLAQFATRRLGREAFEKLIDPMASGVFAGDATNMSLKSCFPRIEEIEQQYRSLILGLVRLQLQARKQGSRDKPSANPSGKLTSFYNGMSELTNAIGVELGARLKLSSAVSSLIQHGGRYQLNLVNGGSEEAERVILASPAFSQATILKELAPEIALLLNDISYPALSICCLGYKRDKVHHTLNGFGFLVPSRERMNILGTLWDASIFPNRAPEGYVLLRTMVGGARLPELALLPETEIVDLVRKDLRSIIGISTTPDFVKVYRHTHAIPQYAVGHADRLNQISRKLEKYPNLILTGNAYKGVSLNDCVANADALADRLYQYTDN